MKLGMKLIAAGLLVLGLFGCQDQGSGGGGNPPPIESVDLSIPKVGMHYKVSRGRYSGLEYVQDYRVQGWSLSFELLSTLATDSPVTLNFRISESKPLVRIESKTNQDAASPMETSLTFPALTRVFEAAWKTESTAIGRDDAPISVTVELLPGEGYAVDKDNRQLVFTFDNLQKPRIEVHDLVTEIEEGEDAEFVVGWLETRGGLKPVGDLLVNLETTQLGEFADNLPNSVLLTTGNGFSSTLAIPTVDDDRAEPNGRINVRVLPGEGYTVQSFVNKAPIVSSITVDRSHIEVRDNDQPRITVSQVSYPVYEGELAEFEIRSETTAPFSDLTINIRTIQTGDFFSEPPPTSFVLAAGEQSDELAIPTADDGLMEVDGHVHVEVMPGSGYVLSAHKIASTIIFDNDYPRIWAKPVKTNVVEGENVEFTIGTESDPLADDLTVSVAILRDGNDFLAEDPPETFTLEAGKEEDILSLKTVGDEETETDGSVTLELRPGSGYLLAAKPFATVSIVDDDLPILVRPQQSDVFEGEKAVFIVGTDVLNQKSDRTIKVRVTQTGGVLEGDLPMEFHLAAGERSGILELPTKIRESADQDGSVAVTLLPGSDYAVHAKNSASIAVKKRDSQSHPTVFISSMKPSVEEGDHALFLIGTNLRFLNTKLTVSIQVSTEGDFLDRIHSEPLPQTVEIIPGRTIFGYVSGMHGYFTEDDELEEADGSITVSLQPGPHYNMTQNQSAATVIVADNDGGGGQSRIPEISIETVSYVNITEGETARFGLFSNFVPKENITVNLSFWGHPDYVLEGSGVWSVAWSAGKPAVYLEVQTDDDFSAEDDPTGSIIYTVLPGNGYNVGATASATVTVLDNDRKLSLKRVTENQSNSDNPIKEGGTAKFELKSTYAPATDLAVSISVISSGNLFSSQHIRKTETIKAGEKSVEFTETTMGDIIHEEDGEFTVRLEPRDHYSVDTDFDSVTVEVQDNDALPTISIRAMKYDEKGTLVNADADSVVRDDSELIEEGATAVFSLESPTAPLLDTVIDVSIGGTSSFIPDLLKKMPKVPVVLRAGKTQTTIEVSTVANRDSEVDGQITAMILPGLGYSVDANMKSASLRVKDNDSHSEYLSIAAVPTDGVVEGNPAQFKLESSVAADAPRVVKVLISQTGNFVLEETGEKEWRIPAGAKQVTVDVATVDDQVEEADGQITATILMGSSYSVDEDFQAHVVVMDNDAPTEAPTVSISTVADSGISEGETAWFRLSVPDVYKGSGLEVKVSVSVTESITINSTDERLIEIPIGKTETVFGIETVDDQVDGSDGSVAVTVLDSTGYRVGMKNVASLVVTDNDVAPVFSISAKRDISDENSGYATIEEQDTAAFEISSLTAPSVPVELKIYVSGTRSLISGALGERIVVFPAGHTKEVFEVATVNDLTYEYQGKVVNDSSGALRKVLGSGIVRATLLEGQGYEIGVQRSDLFIVEDKESFPVMTLAAISSTELSEGQAVEFRINSNVQLPADLPIVVRVEETSGFVNDLQEGNRTVLLLAGATSTRFTIPTESDGLDEPDGVIRVAVRDSTGYNVSGSTVEVTVADVDAPLQTPQITVSAVHSISIGEGIPASFQLNTPTPSDADLTVNYNVSDSGNFVRDGTGQRNMILLAGATEHVFEIATVQDQIEEPDGTITVTITSGSGYSVGQVAEASVRVRDDDTPDGVPELSIVELPGFINEGEPARFRVIVQPIPTRDFTVLLDVSGSSNYIEGGIGVRTMPISAEHVSNYFFKTFIVNTVDNDVNDPSGHGSITVNLLNGIGYSLGVGTRATITVLDNDDPPEVPVITISAVSNSPVAEGSPAWFDVKSSKALPTDLVIDLFVDAPRNMMPQEIEVNWGYYFRQNWSVVLPAEETVTRFGVDTEADNIHEPGGDITVSITDRFGYAVGRDDSAVVQVMDDDPEPAISIWPEYSGTKEGWGAVFRLSASTNTYTHLNISVKISQTGEFLGEPAGYKTLSLEPGYGHINSLDSEDQVFTIDTIDDDVDEEDGSITVTLVDGGGYSVGANSTATMPVLDDDGLPRVLVERVEVEDESTAEIIEGDPARFIVYSFPPPVRDMDVAFAIRDSGNFLLHRKERNTVTIPAGARSANFSLRTDDDLEFEADADIWVSLLSGDGYEIGEYGTASVRVTDNDEVPMIYPEFSILATEYELKDAKNFSYTEGDTISFRISSPIATSSDISVTVAVSDTGNFVVGSLGNRTFEVLAGQSEFLMNLETNQDDLYEVDGTIRVEIQQGSGYSVGRHAVDKVEIKDDDVPKISIAKHPDSAKGVTEAVGAVAKFNIFADISPLQDLTINVTVDDGTGDFLTQTGPYKDTVLLASNDVDKNAIYEVEIANDNVVEDNGRISVTIESGTGYKVGTANIDYVNVSSDDVASQPGTTFPLAGDTPVLSVSSEIETVNEGSDARFSLTVSRAVEQNLAVNLEITETGDFIKDQVADFATIKSGNSSAVVAIATEDDEIAESDGSITVKVMQGTGYVVGESIQATVTISDGDDRSKRRAIIDTANRAVLSEMTGLIGTKSLNAATQRVTQAFSDRGGTVIEFAGKSTVPDLLKSGGEYLNQEAKQWYEVLGRSSFAISVFPEESGSSLLTAWGLGNHGTLSQGNQLSGEDFTGHFGVDALLRKGVLTGVATSLTRTAINYRIEDETLHYLSDSTGVHPYFGLGPDEGNQLQVISGYGRGEIELNQEGYAAEILRRSFFNFGMSGNLNLYSSESLFSGGTSELNINGETWLVSQFAGNQSDVVSNLRSDGRQLRMSLHGLHKHKLHNGALVTPNTSLGVREESRDDQSHFGLEIGSTLEIDQPTGYEISSMGGLLLSNLNRIRDWGVAGMLSYDAGKDQIGAVLDVSTEWGGRILASGGILLENAKLNANFPTYSDENGVRIDATVGYGFDLLDGFGILQPYGRLELTDSKSREYRIGGKIAIGTEAKFELEGNRRLEFGKFEESKLSFNGEFKW